MRCEKPYLFIKQPIFFYFNPSLRKMLKRAVVNLSNDIKTTCSLLTVFFLFSLASSAQLILNPALTPTQLVNLLTGPGVSVSNIVYTGNAVQRGGFTAAGTNLGIANGVVLSTGDINDGVGPNLNGSSGVDLFGAGDTVLDTIAGAVTGDAAILEFDFVPQNDTVSFRYVFASDEYPEYVCSTFNDAFVFHISGPGIVGSQNMAIIPGTAVPVTINTVNSGTPGASANAGSTCVLTYSAYYVDNVGGATLEYDGLTTVLTALAVVSPCQLYHLRIAIADAGDRLWDSAVFFEAGSLFSTPIITAGIDQTFCQNAIANLGSSSISGWTYSWSPSTGLSNPNISNPSLNYSNNGANAIVTNYVATATSGTCVLSDTVQITINPAPTATFSVTPSICIAQQATINYTGNGNAAAVFNWNFSGGNVVGASPGPFQISFANPGDYPISLFVSEVGCISPVVINNLHIKRVPIAGMFTPTNACVGDTITITAAGSNAGSAAIFNWNFGGATVVNGSGSGPYSLVIPNSGPTNFTLSITDSSCVSNLFNAPFTGKALPLASILAPTVLCSGTTDTVFFTGSNLTPNSYSWSFPSTQYISGTGSGPYILKWNVPGYYPVIVNVTDNGCVAIDTSVIHVDLQPVSSFVGLPKACMNDQVQYSFSGTADSLSSYDWTFQNGSLASLSSSGPINLFWDRADTFAITLITTNGACSDTAINSIIVNEKPFADFATQSVCLNDNSGIINNSYLPDTIGNVFDWSFGDSTNGVGNSPSHFYSQWGNYTVQLIITTGNGCKDTAQKSVIVYPLPVAQFATDTVCFGLPNHFVDISQIIAGAINSTKWTWADGNTSIGNQSEYTYRIAGSYGVQLNIVSDNGCKDSTINFAKSLALPIANFNPDFTSGCSPLKVQLFDHSTSVDDTVKYWRWNFGEGSTSNDSFPTHIYDSPGTYSLSLHVITTKGCVDDTVLTKYITIYPIPTANFSFSPESPDIIFPHVNFYDQSSVVNIWNWNFGDSTFSNNKNPDHLYDTSGVFNVTLIVTNEYGCKDTTYKEVIIKNDYTLWIPNAFTPNGDGKNDFFEVKSEGLTDFKMDIFDRWGSLIFTSDNIYKGWNGEVKNRKAIMDTYVYRIEIKDLELKAHVYVGHVNLIY